MPGGDSAWLAQIPSVMNNLQSPVFNKEKEATRRCLLNTICAELDTIHGDERNAFNLVHKGTSREAYVFFKEQNPEAIQEELLKSTNTHKHEAKYCIEYYHLQHLLETYSAQLVQSCYGSNEKDAMQCMRDFSKFGLNWRILLFS